MELGANVAQGKRYQTSGFSQRSTTNNTYLSKPRLPENVPNKLPDKTGTRPEARYKEPGQCRYCGQRWFLGHKCAQYKTLNLLAAEEEVQTDWEEQLQNTDNPNDTEQPATSPTEEEQLMLISMQAIKGKSIAATFTLWVNIGGKRALALVDSGSTNTFIDMSFATKTNCTITKNNLQPVHIAGGGKLQTGAHIPAACYNIQNHQFANDFKLLPLKGYDIILGCDWLLEHSSISLDFGERLMTIN